MAAAKSNASGILMPAAPARSGFAPQQGRILSLVHGCARDQSFGENQLEQLKHKSLELNAQFDRVRATIEEKKQLNKCAEGELKSLEVELSAAEATVQVRQARVEAKQLEISNARVQLEALKESDEKDRDRFIQIMMDMNNRLIVLCQQLET